MTSILRFGLMVMTLVTALLGASRAHALDVGNAVIFCTTLNFNAGTALGGEAANLCQVNAQDPNNTYSICQPVSGDPWICNDKIGPDDAENEDCGSLNSELTINSNLSLPLGWTLSGTIKATLDIKSTLKEVETCDALDKIPQPQGEAGIYTSKTGVLFVEVELNVIGGNAKLENKTLGIKVDLGASYKCDEDFEFETYVNTPTASCGCQDAGAQDADVQDTDMSTSSLEGQNESSPCADTSREEVPD